MPHVPKWMGDAMESLLSSRLLHLKVSNTAALSPSVKKICFSGDLHGTTHKTGYAVAFRVSATAFRNYTPSYFSPEENKC